MDRDELLASKKLEPINIALERAYELAQQVSIGRRKQQQSSADDENNEPTNVRLDSCASQILPISVLHDKIANLKAAVNNVRMEHVSLRLGPYIDAANCLPGKAPFVTIPAMDASWATATIFCVSSGAHLPLHDHPLMIGIIKVLRGALTIHSYDSSEETLVQAINDPSINQTKEAENLEKEKQGIEAEKRQSPAAAAVRIEPEQLPPARRVRVRKTGTTILTSDDEPIVLYPGHGDLHELYGSYDTPTVFFDILLPPYHTFTTPDQLVRRECHYYKRVDTIPSCTFPDKDNARRDPVLGRVDVCAVNIDPSRAHSDAQDVFEAKAGKNSDKRVERDGELIEVEEIPTPSWFFFDHVEYDGPKLEGAFVE